MTTEENELDYLNDSESEDEDLRISEKMVLAPPARESKAIPVTKEHEELAALQRQMNKSRNHQNHLNSKAAGKGKYIDLKRNDGQKVSNFMRFLNPNNLRMKATGKGKKTKIKKKKHPNSKNLDPYNRRERKESKMGLPLKGESTLRAGSSLSPKLKDLTTLRKGTQMIRKVVISPDVKPEESKLKEENVDPKILQKVLTDFYNFHDPVRSTFEVENDIRWVEKNGLQALNDRLKAKYDDVIIVKQAAVPNPITNQRATIVGNRKKIAQSARIATMLEVPGLVPLKTEKVNQGPAVKASEEAIRGAIDDLAESKGPIEIRDNLIEFYRVADPSRLKQYEENEDITFISEILSWTVTFGLPALVSNLEIRFLNVSRADEEMEDVDTEPEEDTPEAMQLDRQGSGKSWKDKDFVEEVLKKFYLVYNPGRLDRPLTDIVNYIVVKGVDPFNERLMKRYHDTLFSFEDEDQVKWRTEITEKLFSFFSKVDPERINEGLSKLIAWTERKPNKEEALNAYLQKLYDCNLESY